MFDQQNGEVARLERPNKCQHFSGLCGVHSCCRFIEQQDARLGGEGACHFEAAAVGVGEAVGWLLQPWQQPFSKEGEDFQGLLAKLCFFCGDGGRGPQRQQELAHQFDEGQATLGGLAS